MPFIIAFKRGRKNTQEGTTAFGGKIVITLLCNISTTANTKIDIPVTILKMTLSFI